MAVVFIVRRDNPPMFMGKFTGTDVVIFIASLFPPWVIFLITFWPIPVCFALSFLPASFYVIRFRMGRPPGYFKHWLRFKLRPKIYRFGNTYSDTLLGARGRYLLCARPLPDGKGGKRIWPGIGFDRYGSAPDKVV